MLYPKMYRLFYYTFFEEGNMQVTSISSSVLPASLIAYQFSCFTPIVILSPSTSSILSSISIVGLACPSFNPVERINTYSGNIG